MKDNKDIIIDSLMARIRELEKELNYINNTKHLTKSTRTKPLIGEYYEEPDGLDDIFYQGIEVLEPTIRTLNNLKAENVYTIGQLVVCKDTDLLKTPNFGKKSLREVEHLLGIYNLNLGMSLEDKVAYERK